MSPDGARLYVLGSRSQTDTTPPFHTREWGVVEVVDTAANKAIGTLDGDADRLALSPKGIGRRADPAMPL